MNDFPPPDDRLNSKVTIVQFPVERKRSSLPSIVHRIDLDADTAGDEIGRLAGLENLEYARERKKSAKQLGLGSTELDKLVQAERRKSDASSKQGKALDLAEPEPWPEPVDGAALLNDVAAAIKRHMVLSPHAADTLTLWAAHTFFIDCFAVSPRLAVTSPEKGCGKTTLLDVLYHLIMRPLLTANATVAAIFRTVAAKRPTLLIDEADTFLAKNDELRGILNSGHRQNGAVIRTVGDDLEPRQFPTYSACAIALIGKLPGTLADRSVTVELRRRRPDEHIESFRFDRTGHLDRLARQAARWALDDVGLVRHAEPDMPAGLHNRLADNWRPLLAIADAAGGDWPERARSAAQAAAASYDAFSERDMLLTDIRAIFSERAVEKISSADLVEALVGIEGRPWAEWRSGTPITQNTLARLLRPLHIVPGTIRTDTGTPKGYYLASFQDAFARYLQPSKE